MNQIPYIACLSLADCAASKFAEWRTSKQDDIYARQYLRTESVRALRFLWATGDADQRASMAARVAVWMDRPVKEIHDRVLARERAREGK